jgi:hypothetical protein
MINRKSGTSSFIATILMLSCIAGLSACGNSNSSNSSDEAALSGLETHRNMALKSGFAFYGYEAESDIGKEELGEPIEVKTIDMDALFESASASDSLIIDKHEYLYPIMVKGELIGCIEIVEDDGDWSCSSTVSKTVLGKAFETISAHSLNRWRSYLLDLEEIELAFVGFERQGQQKLIPLFANASCPFVPGTEYDFTEIADEIKSELLSAQETYESMVPRDSTPDSNERDDLSIEGLFRYQPMRNPALEDDGKVNRLLDVALIPQEQNQWCWAATGSMTMLFAGGDEAVITECAQANDAFSQTACCASGGTSACNKPWLPMYSNWGFTAKERYASGGAYLSWEAFKSTIDQGKPVAFLWRWKKGGGHYQAAVGYYEDKTTNPVTRMVQVNNPWPPNVGEQSSMTYENWAGGSGYDHTQTCYFYDIIKN